VKSFLRVCALSILVPACLAQQPTEIGAGGATITGSVRDAAGNPVASGTVTLSTADSAAKRVEAIAGGRYSVIQLDPGKYDVLFEATGYGSTTNAGIQVAAGQALRLDAHVGTESDPVVKPETNPVKIALAVGMVLLYLLSILVTRWYKIAKPSRNFLMGHIETLKNDLEMNRRPRSSGRVKELEDKLDAIHTSYKRPRQIFRQFMFWSQSTENASWITVHDVERELAAYLSPPEAVQTSLISASAQLKELKTAAATQIAAAIDKELAASKVSAKFRNQLLAEATSMLYGERDNNFTALMDWQNKAMWLILVSCMMLILLAIAAGNAILFLAGAMGGMLGRLMRTLKSSSVPIDYGASWSTLFLSPLFGAFSGWFGIGITVLLASPKVGLLGSLFTQVTWSDTLRLSTLTLAFLLGFSERLFNSLVSAVEQQAEQGTAAGRADNASADAQPAGTVPSAPAQSDYDKLSAKVAAAIGSGNDADKTRVINFLVALGQEADANTTADAMRGLLSKIEDQIGTDLDRQARFVTEAKRAGFSA